MCYNFKKRYGINMKNINFNSVNLQFFSKNDLSYNENELRSYLGVRSFDEFNKLKPRIDDLKECVIDASNPKGCWSAVKVGNDACGNVLIGETVAESKDLSTNLLNCDFAMVFCATLGVGVDRLIRKNIVKSSADGVICNAIASAYIEGLCDKINDQFKNDFGAFNPRYSCGYGDLSITYQRKFLDMLNAEKNIGVFCTDKFILIPSKSVTAIVGHKKGIDDENIGKIK